MRVLCINDEGWFSVEPGEPNCDGPAYMEECTVVGEFVDGTGEYYKLKEWPFEPNQDSWLKECFIPLTGEKELGAEYGYVKAADRIQRRMELLIKHFS